LAVQVKNQIGRIWDNLDSPPYTTLFNEHTTSSDVWRKVQVMRAVDGRLVFLALTSEPRAELVATHGNRFVLHRAFQDPEVKALIAAASEPDQLAATSQMACDRAFKHLAAYLDEKEKFSYLAPLFKNRARCRALASALDSRASAEESADSLFD
jgi:hypothetical protein